MFYNVSVTLLPTPPPSSITTLNNQERGWLINQTTSTQNPRQPNKAGNLHSAAYLSGDRPAVNNNPRISVVKRGACRQWSRESRGEGSAEGASPPLSLFITNAGEQFLSRLNAYVKPWWEGVGYNPTVLVHLFVLVTLIKINVFFFFPW